MYISDMNIRLPPFCITVFLLTAAVFSAENDSTVLVPSPDTIAPVEVIIVTATRSKKRINETPSSVSVITRKEISNSPAKTIEDLLSTQTNIQPRRSVAIGEGIPSDISIRGIPGALAASRTLILVDGIPTNASGTPFLIVNEIPIEAVERIEIVRGPNSSLYGANALGGVINILTQEGRGKPQGDLVTETSYPFTAARVYQPGKGSFVRAIDTALSLAYWNVNGTIRGGTERTGFLVGAGYRTIGDYLLSDSSMVKKGSISYKVRNVNHDYEEFRLLGKVRYCTSDSNSISLHVRYFNSMLGFGQTKNIVPDSQSVETMGHKFLIGPQIKLALSKTVQLKAGAFYRSVIGEFENEGMDSLGKWVPSYWKSQTNDGQIESQVIISAGPSNTITTGLELLRNNADFGATINTITKEILPKSFSVNKGIYNGAGYVQDEIRLFSKKLNIVPIVRVDYHSTFGVAFSPKIGANIEIIRQLRFRSSIGRSFRAPSLAELFMPDLVINPAYVLKCNPDLEPEYLTGADGGFEAQVRKSLTIKIDGFYNKMDDLISQAVLFDSAGVYVTHRNVSKAWSKGIESELEWRPVRWCWISANSAIQSSLDETYNEKLDYVPDYSLGLRTGISGNIKSVNSVLAFACRRNGPRSYLDFTKAALVLTPQGQRLKPLPVPLEPYNTIDISLKLSRSRYSLTLTGQNILNAQWEEAGGTLAPGRFASMKLGISF